MGLALKDAKTRYAHTLEAKEECNGNVGFDFLGFTIRQYPVGKYVSRKWYATIIKPSKKAIERHYRALAAPIERMQAATIDAVIRTLNPKIVGWSNYFRTQVSKKAFHRLDDLLWHKMLGWAKRKHNKKSTALITASATLGLFGLPHGLLWGTEGSRWYLNGCQNRSKHRPRLLPKASFRRRRPVCPREEEVMDRGQTGSLSRVIEASQLMIPQREVPVTPCHIGAGTLEHPCEPGRRSLQHVVLTRAQRPARSCGRKQWSAEPLGPYVQGLSCGHCAR
jgi:hypothetical protein